MGQFRPSLSDRRCGDPIDYVGERKPRRRGRGQVASGKLCARGRGYLAHSRGRTRSTRFGSKAKSTRLLADFVCERVCGCSKARHSAIRRRQTWTRDAKRTIVATLITSVLAADIELASRDARSGFCGGLLLSPSRARPGHSALLCGSIAPRCRRPKHGWGQKGGLHLLKESPALGSSARLA